MIPEYIYFNKWYNNANHDKIKFNIMTILGTKT